MKGSTNRSMFGAGQAEPWPTDSDWEWLEEYDSAEVGRFLEFDPLPDDAYTDPKHPLRIGGAIPEERANRQRKASSKAVAYALREIMEIYEIGTRAELATFLGVGKNQPSKWEEDPGTMPEKAVHKVHELTRRDIFFLRNGITVDDVSWTRAYHPRKFAILYSTLDAQRRKILCDLLEDMLSAQEIEHDKRAKESGPGLPTDLFM